MARRSRFPGIRLAVAAVALAAASAAQAIEYRSVGETAVLYDTPSDKGKKLFVIARGTPVEVIVSLDRWIKVRDPEGAINWIERKSLSDRRMVIVTADRAQIRQSANDSASVSFEAGKNVVLELLEPASQGWARVRHASGEGYIRVTQAWGL